MNLCSFGAVSRRDFLRVGTGSAAAFFLTGLRPLGAGEPPARKRIPIGLQLYSVRGDCGKDLAGTIEAVGKMGYEAVEFAGYYGKTAQELKKLLDDNGLKCCGTHTGLDTLRGDNLKRTVEFHQALGNRFLIVPGMGNKTRGDWENAAKEFSDIAAKVAGDGMRVGYHAHGGDFRALDGSTPWDIFYSAADPKVVMQLDAGNCMSGGGDPVAVLKKFPGRATTIHLKEYGGNTGLIGEGQVKWDQILALCSSGGTEWYIVEQEQYGGGTPLECSRRSLENLKKMIRV
jgi:sugar phosphate isomerase/epimerase